MHVLKKCSSQTNSLYDVPSASKAKKNARNFRKVHATFQKLHATLKKYSVKTQSCAQLSKVACIFLLLTLMARHKSAHEILEEDYSVSLARGTRYDMNR